ncbi:MAG: hypothetical protein P8J27_07915 [Mariniblastus sp.]|nr:hypothetical protein [Mariniblastus sp.]
MSPVIFRLVALCLVGYATLSTYQVDLPDSLRSSLTESPLSAGDEAQIQQLTTTITASEWLGPLAPIAISPFFGVTILAGLSQFGSEHLQNSFISHNPVLSHPAVFWIFLCLTLLTSLPRFTKISKPFAQVIDQLEAYAGIVTIIVIRAITLMESTDSIGGNTATVVQMGMFTMSADILLSLAAIINIIVINTIKFFFEILVWLIPLPFVDAALEIANKSACGFLMLIYAWSPLTATILNLIIFAASLIAFRWVNRQVHYMRSVLCDPFWSILNPEHGVPKKKELVVFPQREFAGFPAKAKLLLRPTHQGWQLIQSRWFLPPKIEQFPRDQYQLKIQLGLFLNNLEVSKHDELMMRLIFSKRYSTNIAKLAELIKIRQPDKPIVVDIQSEFGKA